MLEATLALLAEHGYDFSVEQAAEAAGVHKTTVYRRWETKAALVAAAMQHQAAQLVEVPRAGDPLAGLRALALSVAAALRQPAGANALRAALSSAGSDPALAHTAGEFLRSRYATVVPLVQRAQEQGVIRADVDPVLLWQAIVNPLHLNAVTGGPLGNDVARALVDLVLSGALVRD